MKTQAIKFDVENIGSVEIDVSEKTLEKVIEYFGKLPAGTKKSPYLESQI